MEANKILDLFGEELMYNVRDYCLDQFHNSINREANTDTKKSFQKNFSSFTPEQQIFIKNLVSELTDAALHYFLWMFQNSENFELSYHDSNITTNLNNISDGLCGELYTEDGWIEKYSKYPPSIK